MGNDDGEEETEGVWVGSCGKVLDVGSLQPPNQPGCAHVEVEVGSEDVLVMVGAGAAVCDGRAVLVVPVVVVIGSLQPNQPG